MKNVALIDPSTNYDLVDFNYLKRRGVKVIPIAAKKAQDAYPNLVKTDNFQLETLLGALAQQPIDAICCFYDRLMLETAQIRKRLNLPGLNEEETSKLTDKRLSVQTATTTIKTPSTTLINQLSTYKKLTNELDSQTIFIKPHSQSGSESIAVITSEEAFQDFTNKHARNLDNFIAQEFIDGTLYHIDLVVQNSLILFSSAREYSAPNHKMMTDTIPLFSLPIRNQNKQTVLMSVANNVRKAFNYNNGVMHMEVYLTKANIPIFLEVNIRPPGININKLYAKQLGISFETLMILIEAGVTIGKLKPQKKHFICGYYPIKAGTVNKLNTLQIDVQHELNFFIQPGETYKNKATLSKAASILAWSENQDEIAFTLRRLKAFTPYSIKN